MKNNMRVVLALKKETVASIHEATGIAKSTLTNLYYERTQNPEIQTLLKISDYLDVTIDELLGIKKAVK